MGSKNNQKQVLWVMLKWTYFTKADASFQNKGFEYKDESCSGTST